MNFQARPAPVGVYGCISWCIVVRIRTESGNRETAGGRRKQKKNAEKEKKKKKKKKKKEKKKEKEKEQ